jgi:hypothetical protein
MKTVFTRLAILIFFIFLGYTNWAQDAPYEVIPHFKLSAEAEYMPGRVFLKLKDIHSNQQPTQVASLAHRLEKLRVFEVKKPFVVSAKSQKAVQDAPNLQLIYEVFFPKHTDIEFAVNELLASQALEYAEPRYIYKTFFIPNDTYADTTIPGNFMYHLDNIRAYDAWDISKGETSIVIGISDSGVSFDHIDLRKNLAKNFDDPVDGIDNDNDGYTDNFQGWDFSGVLGQQGDNDPSVPCGVDECVHGVPVAGIAAADTDNGIGVSGVGFNCRFLPLKASPDSLPDGITHGYESILYAAQQGAQIVNCSWGGQTNSKVGADVVKYVHLSYQTGIVAACGNTPQDLKFYPASYPEVLSVANVHGGDSICCPPFLSSTHNYAVDVAAPGWELYSTVKLTEYGPFSGTSASAPVVAGAAGIVMAHFPDYSGFEAGQRLRVTTDDIYQNPYNRPYFEKLGTGRINLYRALTDPRKPSIRLASHRFSPDPQQEAVLPGDSLFIPATFINYLDASSENLSISIEMIGNENVFVSIDNPAWKPGILLKGEQKSMERPFSLYINPLAPLNMEVTLRLRYLDTALNYDDFEYITLTVNPTYVDVRENDLLTSINSRGNIGFPVRVSQKPGLGFQQRPNEQNVIGEAGFMFTDNNGIADNIQGRGLGGLRSGNMRSINFIRRSEHPLAPYYAMGMMEDNTGINTQVKQEVFAWPDPEVEDIILLRYTIFNTGTNAISNGYAGIFADWEIFDPSVNAADYEINNDLIFGYDRLGADQNRYALALVKGERFRALAREKSNFGFSDSDKISALQSPPTSTNARVGTGANAANIIQVLGTGPLAIAAGDSLEVVFALITGMNLNELRQKANRAKSRYECYLSGQGPDQGFAGPTAPVLVGSQFTFQDLNTGASQWSWDFGDGNTSTQQNPTHSYALPGNYLVRMTVTEGNCSVSQEQVVAVRRSVGLEVKTDNFKLEVFPNPASALLHVQWESTGAEQAEIELFNAFGQRVYSSTKSGNKHSISIADFSEGIYVLTIKQGEQIAQQKVMVE